MAGQKKAEPWERQEGETPKQFEAFVCYRDMGEERSLSKVGLELGKSKALMERWSSANNWVDRCVAWDNEQDRLLRLEQIKDIKKMRKRHANLAEAMLVKSAQALKQLKLEDIKAADISRMVETGSKLERISRGDVGEVVEERHTDESISPVQIYLPDNHRDDSAPEE